MKLTGFNNLKKALTFSFYDFVIAPSEEEKLSYIKYINSRYSSKNISTLLKKIVNIIDAEVISESLQDYEPHGASAVLLLSDLKSVNIHLDKSHITAHTYPDFDNDDILSFRVDIELSTCGEITPLKSLDAIFEFFDTDIVTIDYVVRGFTRDVDGKHIYMDHEVNSISQYISKNILKAYKSKDLVLKEHNIWQLKLFRIDMHIDEYFSPQTKLNTKEKAKYINSLKEQMLSIFNH